MDLHFSKNPFENHWDGHKSRFDKKRRATDRLVGVLLK